MPKSRALALLLLLSAWPTPVPADVVTDWTLELLDAVRELKPAPPAASRQMALVTTAMFDAVNSIAPTHEPYLTGGPVDPAADAEVAAATAAHDVLVALYPTRAARFAAHLAADLTQAADGPPRALGAAWGAEVAALALADRRDDGSATPIGYEPPGGAGWWSPTPPAYQATPALPHWSTVRTWGVDSAERFRPPAPPSLRSSAYATAYSEVFHLGANDSTARTADQSEIALFWADGPGTATPPGHWLEIARDLSASHGLGLAENARLFALLGVAVADAAILAWDAKYAYDFWRPVTAIRAGDTDGNPATPRRPNWTPYIATPPFPAYTSGHSTFSGAAARALALFFGADEIAFTTGSDALPGVVRGFRSLSAAADEAGQSRIYGGIHWQFDNVEGLRAGRQAAEEIFARRFRPLADDAPCANSGNEICALGRFTVRAEWSLHGLAPTAAAAIADTDQAGRFWFFDPANTELVVKVVDGCGENDRFWVFLAGLTTLDATVEIVDTATRVVRRYHHSAGESFRPVSDIEAFATCP